MACMLHVKQIRLIQNQQEMKFDLFGKNSLFAKNDLFGVVGVQLWNAKILLWHRKNNKRTISIKTTGTQNSIKEQ